MCPATSPGGAGIRLVALPFWNGVPIVSAVTGTTSCINCNSAMSTGAAMGRGREGKGEGRGGERR